MVSNYCLLLQVYRYMYIGVGRTLNQLSSTAQLKFSQFLLPRRVPGVPEAWSKSSWTIHPSPRSRGEARAVCCTGWEHVKQRLIEEENGMRRIEIGGHPVVVQSFRAWSSLWFEPGARSRQLTSRGNDPA
ncbi:hypothetical protein [Paracidovorax oryzae]|uniref:hypothetical protein n=1 Tax=Paracidovorax oryzae TaxID=862720 RepID=UPI0035CEB6BC